ncbi:MAG: hypothetical protein ABI667_09780 [Sphingomicrobium sp.]
MASPLSVVLLAALAQASVPLGLEATPPYKNDGSWSYFINDGLCSAGMAQPSNQSMLVFAFDADKNAFTVAFTETKRPATPAAERMMGIRLHRAGGVLDDGWEDISFTGLDWSADQLMWVSQPMPDPAMHDFSDFESMVFIDHGRTAGTFRGKNNRAAVRELRRCAMEQKAKR